MGTCEMSNPFVRSCPIQDNFSLLGEDRTARGGQWLIASISTRELGLMVWSTIGELSNKHRKV